MPFTFEISPVLFDIGVEVDYHARATGRYHAGYKGDRIDPPEEPSFEIDRVEILVGKDWRELPSWLISAAQYEVLSEQGVAAYAEDREYHREQAAEMRREDAFFDSMVEICRPEAAE